MQKVKRVKSLHTLTLKDFRSYDRQIISFNGRLNLITGANGSGKTNILEALSFFAPGKGLRSASLASVGRQGGDHGVDTWQLQLCFSGPTGPLDFITRLEAGKRVVYCNEVRLKSQLALSQWVSMSWLTPSLHHAWHQKSYRRTYFDRLVFTFFPSYGMLLQEYSKLLQERILLCEKPNHPWHQTVEALMAEKAVHIFSYRQQSLSLLEEKLKTLGGLFPCPSLDMVGDFESIMGQDQAKHVLQERWAQQRMQDFAGRRTNMGPHITSFVVSHPNGWELPYCSTGEQKSLLLSLTMAWAQASKSIHESEFHFLLLDDVMAHLDGPHRRQLYDLLEALKTFVWITVPEPLEDFSPQHHFAVEKKDGVSGVKK
jgi:DNA replication and repair protein RecF